MDLSKYKNTGGSGDYLPLLDDKQFKKQQDAKGIVTAKILAVREIKNGGKKKDWNGIALDMKCKSGAKYSFLTSLEGYDIGAMIDQMKADDSDDWIGNNMKFITKKGKTGNKLFVNVWRPARKGHNNK